MNRVTENDRKKDRSNSDINREINFLLRINTRKQKQKYPKQIELTSRCRHQNTENKNATHDAA